MMARLSEFEVRVDSKKARDEIGGLAERLKGHEVSDEVVEIIEQWVRGLCVIDSVPPKITKLEQLVARCKCAVHVTANDHTTEYTTVEGHIKHMEERGYEFDDCDNAALAKCVEVGSMWEVTAYPDNPIGSYRTYGATLDEALDAMLDGMPATRGNR